jgi:hypothetical protein
MERVRRLIMNREEIGLFKAVLDSYEEAALLTVIDGRSGAVELIYPEAAHEVVASIMADMERDGVVFREA